MKRMNQRQRNEYAAIMCEIAYKKKLKDIEKGIIRDRFPKIAIEDFLTSGVGGRERFGVTGNPYS